jgi:transposase-like protein
MPRELNFDEHNIYEVNSEIKDMFWQDIETSRIKLTKWLYERGLRADFDSYINAGRHERIDKRRGHRNGYRYRSLLTRDGSMELKVPRDREGGYKPGMFERYKRVEHVVDNGIRAMFLRGVSTRKVGEILDVLFGERLSASYVSQVTKELDRAVSEFGNSPVDDDFRFLYLDGVSVRIKVGLKARRFMILVAYGIRSDGSRRLLSFRRADAESEAYWKGFLENLKVRGLRGDNLELIVMDGSKGLWSAVKDVYPLVEHQLCWVHKLRNVSKYCPVRYREECMSEAKEIMRAKSGGVAANLFRTWKKKWQKLVPRAVKCLQDDFHRLIAVYEFPQEIRKMIRTTNVIERCFREVRRRLRVMGYFQNYKSCNRIIFSLFEYFNSKWERKTEMINIINDLYKKAA